MELEYKGEIKEGKLYIINQQEMVKDIACMDKDCEVTIIIKRRYKRRTDGQNKYYWGVVIPRIQRGIRDLSQDYYDPQEVHDYLKQRLNSKIILNIDTGESIEMPNSTSRLDAREFGEFVDKVKQFALDFLNVDIDADDVPFPNERKNEFNNRVNSKPILK